MPISIIETKETYGERENKMKYLSNADRDDLWKKTANWSNRLMRLAVLPSVQVDDDLWNAVMDTERDVTRFYETYTGEAWIDDPAG